MPSVVFGLTTNTPVAWSWEPFTDFLTESVLLESVMASPQCQCSFKDSLPSLVLISEKVSTFYPFWVLQDWMQPKLPISCSLWIRAPTWTLPVAVSGLELAFAQAFPNLLVHFWHLCLSNLKVVKLLGHARKTFSFYHFGNIYLYQMIYLSLFFLVLYSCTG